MTSKFLMTPNQQYSIFNWFLRKSTTKFSIEIPWLSNPIIEVSLHQDRPNADIEVLTEYDTFDNIPDAEDIDSREFKAMLVTAGVLKPDGWDEAISTIEGETDRNLYEGDRPCRVVFDTNAFLRRYFTLVDRALRRRNAGNSMLGWGYVVTSGIRRELTVYENKYKSGTLKDYENAHGDSWFDFSEFNNQLTSSDRLFRIGSIDCEKMMQSGRCLRVSSKKGDSNIIDGLQKHSHYQSVDLIAVAEDNDFVSKCKPSEIRACRLDIPKFRGHISNINWLELSELLYVLAVRFGAIRLLWDNSKTTEIQGIWRGKKEKPWINEQVLVRPDVKPLYNWLKESLVIGYPS